MLNHNSDGRLLGRDCEGRLWEIARVRIYYNGYARRGDKS